MIIDEHPIPKIEDIFNKMKGAALFCHLDVTDAYTQKLELNSYKREFWFGVLRCAYDTAPVRPESGGLLVLSSFHDAVRPALPWNGLGSVGSCFGAFRAFVAPVHSVHLSPHSARPGSTKVKTKTIPECGLLC